MLEPGYQGRDGKILKLNQDLVARSMVSKAPQKAKKVRTDLAKRVRRERSKGQARVMVSRKVFGSFLKLYVGNVLWFELMRGGEGMPQLKVHDKQGAGRLKFDNKIWRLFGQDLFCLTSLIGKAGLEYLDSRYDVESDEY